MPKKKSAKLDRQLNVRVSATIYESVEEVANALGIDGSDLVRMVLAEKLPEYAERASRTISRTEDSLKKR